MSGVLFVLYIPCDSVEDTGTRSKKCDDKREAKGKKKTNVSEKSETAQDVTHEPLVQSDSGHDSPVSLQSGL